MSEKVKVKPRNQGGVVTFPLEMTVQSNYLHVSSGHEDSSISTDNIDAVVKEFISKGTLGAIAKGKYFVKFMSDGDRMVIPGGTIKGLVRSRLELLVECACYSNPANRGSSTVSQKYKSIFRPARKYSEREYTGHDMCFVCDLMGNMGLASRVSFRDLRFENGKVDVVNMMGKDYQVVTKGTKFSGSFSISNADDKDIGAVLYGLGFRQGSWKVVLMGRFKFQDRKWGRVKFNVPVQGLDKYLSAFMNAHKGHIHDANEEW